MNFTSTLSTSAAPQLESNQPTVINQAVFQPLTFNGLSCARWKSSPTDDITPNNGLFSFDLVSAMVPNHMYHLTSIGADAGEKLLNIPRSDPRTNQLIERVELFLLNDITLWEQGQEIKEKPTGGEKTVRQDVRRAHCCRSAGGRSGGKQQKRDVGGVGKQCAKATRAGLGSADYVASLYDYQATYPYTGGYITKEAILHHELFARFGGAEAVRMVSMTLPNGTAAWIPVYGDFDRVDEVLRTYRDGEEPQFVVSNLELIDGPDIYVAECDFNPVN